MKIGIDLGGMSAKVGICDGSEVVRSAKIETGRDITFEELIDALKVTLESVAAGEDYDFVGISSCGFIDRKGGAIVYSNNIPWKNKPFASEVNKITGKPVGIANDAKCAALAEAVFGAGKGYESVCMLTLGTGVGGAFVYEGKLTEGSVYRDVDCHFGHMTVEHEGRLCTCGRRGCLEAYASATAVMNTYREITGKSLTAKEIIDGARLGGKAENKAVDSLVEYLSDGVANIVNAFRPELVIIGGGLAGGADVFLDRVSVTVNERIFGGSFLPVKFATAKLGNDAGIIGATLLESV